ncbi:hypothetical protein LBW59_24020 [Ralstonia solanacearum]|uniref:Transmembrane protein n=1 Tax=Ralstonia solanacearum TaxID=305 RepID=A0AAW5ZW20_RALSL|nr:hypothetical protein [Ralstonia solanacearum]MDB0573818.1 hypothetical protein [Ralstonia solanacearum]
MPEISGFRLRRNDRAEKMHTRLVWWRVARAWVGIVALMVGVIVAAWVITPRAPTYAEKALRCEAIMASREVNRLNLDERAFCTGVFEHSIAASGARAG